GRVYYAAGREVKGKIKTDLPQIPADVEVKNGVAWARSVEFPNPVFFAFKTTTTGWTPDGAPGGCGDWVDGPPRSSQGRYFVGLSDPLGSERIARDAAMANARVQLVKYLGEQIDVG